MTIRDCFEMEAFNELITFSFDEVKEVFNKTNMYFVLPEQGDDFTQEAIQVKTWYAEELDKIEKYAQEDYTNKINTGVFVPDYDEPQYKIKNVEIQAKRKLIRLISKYFNKEQFDRNREEVSGLEIFKEPAVETPHEMLIALNLHKNKIYSLLSTIGYYQRHYGYFLSKADFLKICYEYSNQVYFINKKLGMEYHFINIFLADCRIAPNKKRKTSDGSVEEQVEKAINEKHQSSKYIDIDKISLLSLIQPYLKHNTKEITKIIEIMTTGFEKYKDEFTWDSIWAETAEYISECEKNGIMKRL